MGRDPLVGRVSPTAPIYGKLSVGGPQGNFEVFAGIAFGGKLRLEDEDGDRITHQDYDPMPLFGVRYYLSFY